VGFPSLDIALLCSDASLWTRYITKAQSFDTLVHTDKPSPMDSVVVTDLAVVAALCEARLPVESAITRGLLVIEASRDDANAVEALLTAACGKPSTGGIDIANRTPWGPPGLR
jgi:hypothetical protein